MAGLTDDRSGRYYGGSSTPIGGWFSKVGDQVGAYGSAGLMSDASLQNVGLNPYPNGGAPTKGGSSASAPAPTTKPTSKSPPTFAPPGIRSSADTGAANYGMRAPPTFAPPGIRSSADTGAANYGMRALDDGSTKFSQVGNNFQVNQTGETGISRVTSAGEAPLYTNIDPTVAVSGLKSGGGDNSVNLSADNAAMARANAIRQSMIDSQPAGARVGLYDARPAETQALFDKWAREAFDKQIANAPAHTAGDQARLSAMVGLQNANTQADTARRGQDISAQSHLGGIDAQGRTARDVAGINADSHLTGIGLQTNAQRDVAGFHNQGLIQAEQARQGSPLTQAQVKHLDAQTANLDAQTAAGKVDPYLGMVQKLYEAGVLNEKDPAHARILTGALSSLARHYGESSGVTSSPEAAKIYAAVKAGTMSRADGEKAMANLERKYASGGPVETPEQLMARMAAKYGIASTQQAPAPTPAPQPQPQPQPQQPVPQNRGLSVGSAVGAIQDRGRQLREVAGYALGGPISVGGRQVLGEGDGKSDSLPAQIDGTHPAALSSGEFVMPVETVRHFGLAKLNKMVADSRKGA